MLDNMTENKAYYHAQVRNGGDPEGELLRQFRERYVSYREAWRNFPKAAIRDQLTGSKFKGLQSPPLCIDIEVAAVCDLACPFCYRQFVATPDKVIEDELAFRLIEEASALGVPSIKFNWRGEPLLYPRLAELVSFAKRHGILETIINTNATHLTDEVASSLIKAGLDLIIYSFDGGSKETYERMRPGRFKDNRFDVVYGNIRRFSEIRKSMNSVLPRTKIQMILTDETFDECEDFYSLFSDCVDDVSAKQYTERGGRVSELDAVTQQRLKDALLARNLPLDTPFFRDLNGKLFYATGRLPCEQPYQRLLVTYDGRVGMCCYDWGAQHPVGYADYLAIEIGDIEYSKVVDRAQARAKGFIPLQTVAMPKIYNKPADIVQSLSEIWTGSEIDQVRTAHIEGKVDDISICKGCPFKETYSWEPL